MPKVIFDSTRTVFSTNVEVLVNHLNYGAHVGYDSVLSILQDARMRWLKRHGLTEVSLEGPVGYVISEVAVNYKSEGFFGDVLDISLYPDSVGRKTFTLKYQITNLTTGRVMTVAETGHVGFNFGTRTLAPLPETFCGILNCPSLHQT